ncbi:MAG: hypothetical protein DELT_00368 [Desulfovibrio sp.]
MPQGFAITRDAATKAATLVVSPKGAAAGPWEVFARGANSGAPVAFGTQAGDFPLPGKKWTLFAVRQNGETHCIAERRLPMRGGYNFRDLGGFAGHGGKHVAWGKFFRTDDLKNLTEDDTAYLASIPLATIIDFRTQHECDRAPDTVPPGVKKTLHYPVMPGNLGPRGPNPHDYPSMDAFMLAIYQGLVREPEVTATYKAFFAHVQTAGDIPLLFHCAAGKDRTGFAAALILAALGVDREIIFSDYEASNVYLGSKYASLIKDNPEKNGLFTVKREFLAESFRIIDEERGGMETYLASDLGVTIAWMRETFLA